MISSDKAARLKEGMTPRDLVRKYFPGATDEECDWLLWERTCFPLDIEKTEKQLAALAEQWRRMLNFLALRADRKEWLVVLKAEDVKLLIEELDDLKHFRKLVETGKIDWNV